jgi:hypothetical protein
VDLCPVCARPRCGADAAAGAAGCLACGGRSEQQASAAPGPGELERLVRAALAGYGVALVGGLVASEYVGATVFAYLGPFVVGVVCGGAATKAAVTDGRGALGTRVRVIAAVLAVVGVGLGFVIEGSLSVLSLDPDVLLPYAAAAAGAVLWTIPPRARRDRQGLSTDV